MAKCIVMKRKLSRRGISMKRGVTLISIIIYLVLFTTFTAFAVSISSNINTNVLSNKGNLIVENDYSKIYTNIFTSAKNSNYYSVSEQKVSFSNGDEYLFDAESNTLYKNGGAICNTISEFAIFNASDISNTTIDVMALQRSEALCIKVTLKKYNSALQRDIIVSLGDDLSE